jgi:hypothetical protein
MIESEFHMALDYLHWQGLHCYMDLGFVSVFAVISIATYISIVDLEIR